MGRIVYLSQSYVPSRRADSIHVVHMCDALASASHDVELVTKNCPQRYEPGVTDDHAFYGVSPQFTIAKLARPDFRGGGIAFSLAVSRYLRKAAGRVDLAICRFLWGAREAVRLGLPTIYEAHGVPTGRFSSRWFQEVLASDSLVRLVVITSGLLADLESSYTIPREKVLLEPDAVRSDFIRAVSPPPDPPPGRRPRVGYVGHLYAGRGIPRIIDLATKMPDVDFQIVGGHDEAINHWQDRVRSSNLEFSGFVQPHALPGVYERFDVLLMPHQRTVGAQSGRSDIVRWTSPMKMFEYMATGRPIVASALPVLREILIDDSNALLADPEDSAAWETCIRRLLENPMLARRLGSEARKQVVENYTWKHRAAHVVEGLS